MPFFGTVWQPNGNRGGRMNLLAQGPTTEAVESRTMTYRQLLEALAALPQEALDRPVTAHFQTPTDSSPVILPIARVAQSGDLLAGQGILPMMGDDLPILTGNRAR